MAPTDDFPALPATKLKYLLVAVIILACLASYAGVLDNGFVWDDHIILVDNHDYRALDRASLYWMATTIYDAQYHPLVWISFALDYRLWRMDPFGYHLTSLLWHIANSIVLFFLIQTLTRIACANPRYRADWRLSAVAAFGSLFFALHPLNVESVAYASARGNLLSAFFVMLSVLAYVQYVRTDTRRGLFFVGSLMAFGISLTCKAWGITVPLILLILDYYPLQRFRASASSRAAIAKVLIEKTPFFVFSVIASIVAYVAKSQRSFVMDLAEHGFAARILQSAYGMVSYVHKLIVPVDLSPLYLLGNNTDFSELRFVAAAIALSIFVIFLFVRRRRWPGLVAAFACYVLVLSPILGIVQVGPQLVADRYAYIAMIPLIVFVSGCWYSRWAQSQSIDLDESRQHPGTDRPERLPPLPARIKRAGGLIAVSAVLVALGLQSARQTRVWRDDNSLWSRVVSVEPSNYWGYRARAVLQVGEGQYRQAKADFDVAIALNPDDVWSVIHRGSVSRMLGDFDAAMQDFDRAIQQNPKLPEAFANRGAVHFDRNQMTDALADFERSLELACDDWKHRKSVIELRHKTIQEIDEPTSITVTLSDDVFVDRQARREERSLK